MHPTSAHFSNQLARNYNGREVRTRGDRRTTDGADQPPPERKQNPAGRQVTNFKGHLWATDL